MEMKAEASFLLVALLVSSESSTLRTSPSDMVVYLTTKLEMSLKLRPRRLRVSESDVDYTLWRGYTWDEGEYKSLI